MSFNFTALFFAALAFGSTAHGHETPCDAIQVAVSTTPVIEQSPGKLKAAIEAGIANAPDVDVMVAGDSLAAGWQEFADRDLPGRRAHWFGVRGERTQEFLWRLQHHSPDISPRHIILIIGTNNLSDRTATACGIAAGIFAAVASIEDRWPTAAVTLVPILPRGNGYAFRKNDRAFINAALRRRFIDHTPVRVLDLDEHVLTCGGKMTGCRNYVKDNLHLSGEGYRFLASSVPKL
ncbi:GDSL-type esterase/lipase family protein [Sinorhizobium chiapasense]|uniref:GDSL-type esterase/lipase family protein n=1 Tax=Sinorhizobium chiapasense TaxID=501572 RepID=A0ABZ2BJZ0_9HYPH